MPLENNKTEKEIASNKRHARKSLGLMVAFFLPTALLSLAGVYGCYVMARDTKGLRLRGKTITANVEDFKTTRVSSRRSSSTRYQVQYNFQPEANGPVYYTRGLFGKSRSWVSVKIQSFEKAKQSKTIEIIYDSKNPWNHEPLDSLGFSGITDSVWFYVLCAIPLLLIGLFSFIVCLAVLISPEMVEAELKQSTANTYSKKTSYEYNGKHYTSLEEMPQEAKLAVKEALASGRLKKNLIPKIEFNINLNRKEETESDEDAELEDLTGKNLPGAETMATKADIERAEEMAAIHSATSNWYYGVLFFGLSFIYFGARIGAWALKNGHMFSIFGAVSLAMLLCGAGLIKQKNWARILAFFALPPLIFLNLAVLHRAPPGARLIFVKLVLCLSPIAFIYLLLPSVKKLFVTAKRLIRERRLLNIAPPPRAISLPLKLSVVYGNVFVLMCWGFCGMVFLTTLGRMNLAVGGFDLKSFSDSWPQWSLAGAFVVSVVITAYVASWAIKHSTLDLDYLINWKLCYGVLKSKVKITMHDSAVYRLKFEYEVDGQKYTNISDTGFTSRLEDEAEEPILYNPQKPRDSMLVDELPAHITLDGQGGLKSKYPFMGYFYACIPLALLAAMFYFAFRGPHPLR